MSMSCIAIRIVYRSNRIPIRIVSIVPDRYSALVAAIAFMFAMSMAPQRLHRQWQVNANGRLNALFSMGCGVDVSQLWRYTKVKIIYTVQCSEKWLTHTLMIFFGYFILEILIPMVTAKPFVNVIVLDLWILLFLQCSSSCTGFHQGPLS